MMFVAACSGRPKPSGPPDGGVALAVRPLPSVLQSARPRVPVTLDLSNAEHRKFLMDQLKNTAFTSTATPQLHRTITAMGAPPPAAKTFRQIEPPPENLPVDLIDIVNTSAGEDGVVRATAIASAVGRSTFVHAVLRLIDADTGDEISTPAYASSFTGVNALMRAEGRLARTDQRVNAVVTAVFAPYSCPPDAVDCVPRPGRTTLGSDVGTTAPALTAHVSGDPYAQVMSQPITGASLEASATITPANPPVVVSPVGDGGVTVCLGRQPGAGPTQCSADGGGGCTYCDSTQPYSATPIMRMPISGTVNLRNAAAATPQITGFSSYVVPSTGGSCQQYNTTSGATGFTTLNNGLTVRWNYGSSNWDVPNWAQYGQLTSGSNCWTNTGEPLYWNFSFTVVDLQGNQVPIVVNDFGQPSANTAVALPTSFAYGCLAKGTPVLMANGKTKVVQDIQPGELIRSEGNITRAVGLTYTGNEYLPLIQLTTDKGSTVTITEGHPVIGGDGKVLIAKKLKVGDGVMTQKGKAKLTRVERLPPKEGEGVRVYNLDVEAVDQKAPLTATNRTFYAGGILVGDNFMQRDVGRQVLLNATLGDAMPVPPEWAAEFALSKQLANRR